MAQIRLDQTDANKDPKKAEMPGWAKPKDGAGAGSTTESWAAIHFRCGDALRGALAPTYGVLQNKWYTDILKTHPSPLTRVVVVAKLEDKGDDRILDKGTGAECRALLKSLMTSIKKSLPKAEVCTIVCTKAEVAFLLVWAFITIRSVCSDINSGICMQVHHFSLSLDIDFAVMMRAPVFIGSLSTFR
jgi:hypothetical protein